MRYDVVDRFLDECEGGEHNIGDLHVIESWLGDLGWQLINRWPFKPGFAWYDDIVKRAKTRKRGSKVASCAESIVSKVCE